jgi:hypothetical protein
LAINVDASNKTSSHFMGVIIPSASLLQPSNKRKRVRDFVAEHSVLSQFICSGMSNRLSASYSNESGQKPRR